MFAAVIAEYREWGGKIANMTYIFRDFGWIVTRIARKILTFFPRQNNINVGGSGCELIEKNRPSPSWVAPCSNPNNIDDIFRKHRAVRRERDWFYYIIVALMAIVSCKIKPSSYRLRGHRKLSHRHTGLPCIKNSPVLVEIGPTGKIRCVCRVSAVEKESGAQIEEAKELYSSAVLTSSTVSFFISRKDTKSEMAHQ